MQIVGYINTNKNYLHGQKWNSLTCKLITLAQISVSFEICSYHRIRNSDCLVCSMIAKEVWSQAQEHAALLASKCEVSILVTCVLSLRALGNELMNCSVRKCCSWRLNEGDKYKDEYNTRKGLSVILTISLSYSTVETQFRPNILWFYVSTNHFTSPQTCWHTNYKIKRTNV